jgi:hypothetical protein
MVHGSEHRRDSAIHTVTPFLSVSGPLPRRSKTSVSRVSGRPFGLRVPSSYTVRPKVVILRRQPASMRPRSELLIARLSLPYALGELPPLALVHSPPRALMFGLVLTESNSAVRWNDLARVLALDSFLTCLLLQSCTAGLVRRGQLNKTIIPVLGALAHDSLRGKLPFFA